jgi:hypothetical protein
MWVLAGAFCGDKIIRLVNGHQYAHQLLFNKIANILLKSSFFWVQAYIYGE